MILRRKEEIIVIQGIILYANNRVKGTYNPVSYTHLDVYKRQKLIRAIKKFIQLA